MSESKTSPAEHWEPVLEPELRGRRFQQHAPRTIALDVAENVLLSAELRELLCTPPLTLEQADLNYLHDSIGTPVVRQAIADLLSQTWSLNGPKPLLADDVLCTPGASAALHFHARARMQPGDSVLIPSPYWQMFDRIYHLAGVEPIGVPLGLERGEPLELAALERAYREALASGARPRAIVLTNPHNPLGTIQSPESMEALFQWALKETDMDVVSDEIYAHSRFRQDVPFVSALALDVALAYPERVHAIWGFAKDFGLSGWLAGVLLTRNHALHKTITTTLARFSPFDGLKNRVIHRLLCERDAAHSPLALLELLPRRLQAVHAQVASALESHSVRFDRRATAAPFFWLDLREYLDANLERAAHPAECVLDGPEVSGFDPREGRLHKFLACAAGVTLLRGQVMHCSEPGFFRLCFTAEQPEIVLAAVDQIGQALARAG